MEHQQHDDPVAEVLKYLGAALALVLVAFVLGVAFGFRLMSDGKDAEVTAKIVSEVDERKVSFRLPLDCDATVTSSVAGTVTRDTCFNRATAAQKWQAP